MNDSAITVQNLSKRYTIGRQTANGDGLRHAFDAMLRNPFAWLRERNRARRATREDFWALKDVSFEIKRGDAVAIIGRNGAGKSTLLKILSRITEPTEGRIDLHGRVASLLEVGTGFHQELTGRENIYLNGAILGMTHAEIRRKFDEIVAFSEIEKFLDTPVKRYSSGMYVRLAFAVAAHLEPEILIVDEVLAVGDANFQRKCLGKMEEVAHGGRTVLFVSHNMPAVQALCSQAIYLQAGSIRGAGDAEPIIGQYLAETGSAQGQFAAPLAIGTDLTLTALELSPNPVENGQPLEFAITFRAERATVLNELSVLIYSLQNTRVASLDLRSCGMPLEATAGQAILVRGEINSMLLVEGEYRVGLFVSGKSVLENFLDLTGFTVRARRNPTGYAPYPAIYRGVVELPFTADLQCRATLRSSATAQVAALVGDR